MSHFQSRGFRLHSDISKPPASNLRPEPTLTVTWKNVRVAVPKAQDPDELTTHQTIPAEAPDQDLPQGRCGTALLHWSSDAETVGLQGEFLFINIP